MRSARFTLLHAEPRVAKLGLVLDRKGFSQGDHIAKRAGGCRLAGGLDCGFAWQLPDHEARSVAPNKR